MAESCTRTDCARPRQPYGAYCCNLCADRSALDLAPGHNTWCDNATQPKGGSGVTDETTGTAWTTPEPTEVALTRFAHPKPSPPRRRAITAALTYLNTAGVSLLRKQPKASSVDGSSTADNTRPADTTTPKDPYPQSGDSHA